MREVVERDEYNTDIKHGSFRIWEYNTEIYDGDFTGRNDICTAKLFYGISGLEKYGELF